MDRKTILALATVGRDEVDCLSRQLGKPIDMDYNALIMLARMANNRTNGEDYMRVHVRILVDDMIRRDPEAMAYKYEYEPPDADARRQAGTL